MNDRDALRGASNVSLRLLIVFSLDGAAALSLLYHSIASINVSEQLMILFGQLTTMLWSRANRR